MRIPLAIRVALLVLVILPGATSAQSRLDAGGYQALLEEVRGGLFISSGRALGGFAPDSVERVVRDFIASDPGALELKAAALLHTEAAPLAPSVAERHFQWARELLGAIPDPAERHSWLRRWWLAVASSFQVQLVAGSGVAAFETALEDLPGDREVRSAFASALWMFGRQREEPVYLSRAFGMLTELLAETPEDGALRVQLAGVMLDLGRTDEALRELERIGDARLPSGPRLAALLIRGEIALGEGRYADAETAFAEAVRRSRRSPAAVSGLVAARLAQGNTTGASEAATALLARRQTGWEPEWRYWLGPALDYPEMFQEMKDEIRQSAASGGEK